MGWQEVETDALHSLSQLDASPDAGSERPAATDGSLSNLAQPPSPADNIGKVGALSEPTAVRKKHEGGASVAGQQFSPPLSYACLSVPPPEAWRLIDFITDAVRQVSDRVRLVYLITRLDLTGEWEAAHAQGLLYVLDQDGNEIEGWAETADGPEWAELRARPGPWRHRRIPYGQEAYAGAPLSTTSTTTIETSPDPPSLLHVRGSRQRPPSCADPGTLPFEVLPAQLAQTRVRVLPASCLHLAQSAGGGFSPAGTFTVFCDMSEPQFLAADAAWTVDQYLRTAAARAESRPRLIRVINVPLPGLPTPQLTVTTTAAEEGSVTLPLDARDLGGDIFAITIGPAATPGGVLDALVQISPDLAPALQALHAVDGVFLQDDLGQHYFVANVIPVILYGSALARPQSLKWFQY
ncbi:hypothetical protein AK812_SmicGene42427 [Symbiodinium microadriaticum]|uniref:Uncharacterized protein n=1 Tax=Symbiodinium microadriaticum TaxID=2951 RepID=A0A1Q9C3K2_SYMMI|nr:hypothetical protein AK812_SmicGene42427 [Symbiodinium microadriaticum]